MNNDLKFVWKKLTQYKKYLIIIGFSGLIYSASKALIAHFVKQLMDTAAVPENMKTLAFVGIGIAFMISISRYFHIFLMNMVSEKVTQDIRQDLQAKFLKLNLKFHNNYASGSGGLLSRTFNDVRILQDGLRLFADVFTAPLMFMAVLFNLFYFDKKLALAILLITPLILFALKQLSKSIKKYSVTGVEQLERLTSTIKESLDGVRTIQAFNLERFFKDKLKIQGDEFISIRKKVHKRVEMIGPVNEFVATVILVAIFYYFSLSISKGESTYGILMAYLTTIMQANEPIKKFQEAIVRIQESRVCADRIQRMLTEDSEIQDSPDATAFPKTWDSITYKDVSFSYNNETFIKNFNLTIKKGQTIALVGESGSGKTTIANLLARFYDLSSGQINVGSVPLQQIRLHDLRKNIGLVSQDVFLFSDSLTANISAGLTKTTNDQIISTSKAAHAYTFIQKMEHQFDTAVGERGNNLSGGEKQRIAIARALYKDAPILILDEATSALDSVSEQLVQSGLEELMKGRTTVVIAHRLSTIQKADVILVMKNGSVVEQGQHAELIQKNSEYAKLYHTQNLS